MNIKDFHSWCHSHSVVSEKTNGKGGPKKDIVGKYHPGGEAGYQGFQTAASAAGNIPVVGAVADIAAAGHSLASGRIGDTVANLINTVPGTQFTGAGVAKTAKSGAQLANATVKTAKAAKAAKETKIANKAKLTISGKN